MAPPRGRRWRSRSASSTSPWAPTRPGSGRVPAALNGIVGVKPTRGLVPVTGVVPACYTLDCVTVFARDLTLARTRRRADGGRRPGSIRCAASGAPATRRSGPARGSPFRPPSTSRAWRRGWREAFAAAVRAVRRGRRRDRRGRHRPLLEAASLLYDGAFVAERYAAVGEHIEKHADLIGTGPRPDRRRRSSSAAQGQDRRRAGPPTPPGSPRSAPPARAAPRRLRRAADAHHHLAPHAGRGGRRPGRGQRRMGRFTNFANLLDLASLAVPAGFVDGLPFGVMLTGAGVHRPRRWPSWPHGSRTRPRPLRRRRAPHRPAAERPARRGRRHAGRGHRPPRRLPAARARHRPPKPGLVRVGRRAEHHRGRGVAASGGRIRHLRRARPGTDGDRQGDAGRRPVGQRLPRRTGRAGERAATSATSAAGAPTCAAPRARGSVTESMHDHRRTPAAAGRDGRAQPPGARPRADVRRASRSSTRPPRSSPSAASRRPPPALIAERVGIRQASLYYHFAGKDELLIELLDHLGPAQPGRVRGIEALVPGTRQRRRRAVPARR